MSSAGLCVILLNYGNWRDTLECLESLTRSTFDPLSVVVVDTGSPNDSVERLIDWAESGADARAATPVWQRLPVSVRQRPRRVEVQAAVELGAGEHRLPRLEDGLTIITSRPRLGFAAGCNAGLRRALADPATTHVWLLNNDAIAAPDAASYMAERATELGPRLGALGSVIADYRNPDRIQILGGGWVDRLSAEVRFPAHGEPLADASVHAADLRMLDYVSGASLWTSAEAIHRIGLLDETMHLYWEDTDWCARARAVGLRIAVCPRAIVWHKGQSSTGGINRYTKYHNLRSATVYMRRHRRQWLTPLLVRLAKSLARDLLIRPRDAAGSLRGLAAGLRLGRTDPPPPLHPPDCGRAANA